MIIGFLEIFCLLLKFTETIFGWFGKRQIEKLKYTRYERKVKSEGMGGCEGEKKLWMHPSC
eukprot:jgi/Bigna1/65318/fgenesh1_kg.105_\